MNRNNPPALLSCHVWPTRRQVHALGSALLWKVHAAEEGMEARVGSSLTGRSPAIEAFLAARVSVRRFFPSA